MMRRGDHVRWWTVVAGRKVLRSGYVRSVSSDGTYARVVVSNFSAASGLVVVLETKRLEVTGGHRATNH